MKRNGLIGWIAAAFLLTTSAFSHAFIVTIEPDDYAAGTDLSNVSPYVTLSSRSYLFGNGNPIDDPVTATAPVAGHSAPTGNLSFGYHSFNVWPDENGDPVFGGLALTFHQEVSQLTLWANNDRYPGQPVAWAAYDRDGNWIGNGGKQVGVPGGPGETFLIDIPMENVWTIVLGGNDGINAMIFDGLSFNVVPEPGTWMLLLPGLLVLALRRKSMAA